MRVLIVDDEPPARARMRRLLEGHADIEVIGEAADGEAAVSLIDRERPDVVFLDVQMPGLDGFGVVRELPRDNPPAVVFVTAFDEHAVRAFDVHAVDYLVKPCDGARLQTAIERVRLRLSGGASRVTHDGLAALVASLREGPSYLTRVAVRVGDRIYYVRIADVDWVEADGNYVRLHTGGGTPQARSHLIRKPLSVLAGELDPRQFARIHRSSLVNVDRIKELRSLYDGEYQVLLTDGTKLKLSKTYRTNLPDF